MKKRKIVIKFMLSQLVFSISQFVRKYSNVADRKDIIEGRLFMEKTKEVKNKGTLQKSIPN